jgi:hypothetical protein
MSKFFKKLAVLIQVIYAVVSLLADIFGTANDYASA